MAQSEKYTRRRKRRRRRPCDIGPDHSMEKKLLTACEALTNDSEYQVEVKLWDACAGDGMEDE